MTTPVSNQSKPVLWTSSALILGAMVVIWVIWFNSARQPVVTDDQLLPLQALPSEPIAIGESLVAAQVVLKAAQSTLSNGDRPKEQASTPKRDDTPAYQSAAPAWDMTNAPSSWDEAQNSIPLPDSVVVYEPVRVDMDSPDYPAPGQQRRLSLPGGEEWVVDVKSSAENPNGDYSWRGHLEGYGTDYPVVMTYGANSVFATITTPNGSYTLESVNGSGWVYKNPSEFELSDPGKNDYLEVPHLHNHD